MIKMRTFNRILTTKTLRKKMIKDELGAETIELMAALFFYIVLFFIFFQIFVIGIQVYKAETAVREAAKVYAISGRASDAQAIIDKALGNTRLLEYGVVNIKGNDMFTVEVPVTYHLSLVDFIINFGNKKNEAPRHLAFILNHQATSKLLLPH